MDPFNATTITVCAIDCGVHIANLGSMARAKLSARVRVVERARVAPLELYVHL